MSEDVKMCVDAGACRFKTTIVASMQDDGSVRLEIESGCPQVKRMAETLPEIDPMDAASKRMLENPVIISASENLSHPSCPIPCAILKAVEVASGLALEKDPTLHYCSPSP